eukprot:2538294-Pyramimonas_sp.AAC.1
MCPKQRRARTELYEAPGGIWFTKAFSLVFPKQRRARTELYEAPGGYLVDGYAGSQLADPTSRDNMTTWG